MIIHHLCECSGHATGHGLGAARGEALQVEGLTLVPTGGEHRCNHLPCLVGSSGWAFGGLGCCAHCVIGACHGDFLSVAVEQGLHVLGDVGDVEMPAVGIAQHVACLVVAGDDDEAFVSALIEYIVACFFGRAWAGTNLLPLTLHEFQVGCCAPPFIQELRGFLQCLRLADRRTNGCGCNHCGGQQSKDVFSHDKMIFGWFMVFLIVGCKNSNFPRYGKTKSTSFYQSRELCVPCLATKGARHFCRAPFKM